MSRVNDNLPNDPPRSTGYYIVREWLRLSLYCYYSYFEVVGADKFPAKGPVILAANHSNSLGDAATLLRAAPRAVRLTCKNTLLHDPVYGWIVRGVDSIGVRRRIDHGGKKVDNRASMQLVRAELRNGCCVGLFPEGLGRYKPDLSDFKVGVISTAIDFVTDYYRGGSTTSLIDQANSFDHIFVMPMGINFFRREMFRSACGVRFGDAIRVDADLLRSHGLDCDKLNDLNEEEFRNIRYKIAKELTSDLKKRIESMVCVSKSWKNRRLCEFATDLIFPEMKYVNGVDSCAGQYASTNLQFARALDQEEEEESNGSDDKVNKLDQLWSMLYNKGVQLETVQNNLGIGTVIKDSTLGLLWLLPSLPGLVAWIPMFAFWRWDKIRTIRSGMFRNFDGLASTKQPPLMVGSPTLVTIYSGMIFGYLYRSQKWTVQKSATAAAMSAFVAFPLAFQLMLSGFPRFMYRFGRAYSAMKWSLFTSNEQRSSINNLVDECCQYLSGLIDKFGISGSDVMDCLTKSERSYISKSSWGLPITQVCRIFHIPYHDYPDQDLTRKED